MKQYYCTCGQRIFFDNSLCLNCNAELGFCPVCARMSPLVSPPGERTAAIENFICGHSDCAAPLRKCYNYHRFNVCNRMVLLSDKAISSGSEGCSGQKYCDCCCYNDITPDLQIEGHAERWADLEAAKRRLFYTLDLLGLPRGTCGTNIAVPLSFSFMADALPDNGLWHPTGEERVYTGHAGGHITINIREADSVEREKLRVNMNEPHRTLIGHFRHEIGHYYWELLVRDRDEVAYIAIFGDHNNPSYNQAIDLYYDKGPPENWEESYISAYATMHSWEDFAETFAFYLDVVAVLDTAQHAGVRRAFHDYTLAQMLEGFAQVGITVNELNREMGLLDLVPEIITPAIERKLHYVHDLCQRAHLQGAGLGRAGQVMGQILGQ